MRLCPLVLFAVAACGDVSGAPSVVASPPKASVPASSEAYGASVERLRVQREQFAKELARAPEPDAVLSRARTALLDAVTTELLPAWSGTPWAMQGTATVPGEDSIACGYFVSTVLRDAGLSLHRVRFGQAAALRIQNATTPAGVKVHQFFSIPPAKLAERIEGLGDGMYIIGLNVHVGFVVVRDGEARLVHSSYTGDRVVTDEPLASAVAISNSQPQGYFVSELFTTDASVRKWLEGGAYELPAA